MVGRLYLLQQSANQRNAIMNRIVELKELIATLESDLKERPRVKEFAYDFERDMMQKALTEAKNELRKLTVGV